MSAPFLIVLLALLAIAIAAIPVLMGSFRHDRSIDDGGSGTLAPHESAPDGMSTVVSGRRR
jgi:uncharacterized protein (UPF0333 family)